MSDLSWLNPTPHAIAVYASRPLSPGATQHSLPSGRYSLLGPDFHRLDRTSFAWRTHSITNLDRLWSWLVGLRDLKMRDIVKGTGYEKCLQHAAFLGIDLVRTIEAVISSHPFNRRRGREHAIGLTRCLEARGDVDGVAPDVVGELTRADNPCHHGAGMQSHPDRKWGWQPRSQARGGSNHVEGEFRRHPDVIGARRRYARDRHVGVADRLYLFDSGIFSKLVELAEQQIEAGDDFIGLHARRDLAEADDVSKNDGSVIEVVRDVAFPVAQACRDLSRQNVAQEILRMPLLVLDLAYILVLQRS